MATRDDGPLDLDSDGATAGARVEERIELDASVDDVWRALTDPDELGAWLGGEVHIEMRPAALPTMRSMLPIPQPENAVSGRGCA